MHRMSKETASTLAGMQSRLTEAEGVLKAILEDESITSREYLVALATTYFSPLRNTGDRDEKKI